MYAPHPVPSTLEGFFEDVAAVARKLGGVADTVETAARQARVGYDTAQDVIDGNKQLIVAPTAKGLFARGASGQWPMAVYGMVVGVGVLALLLLRRRR